MLFLSLRWMKMNDEKVQNKSKKPRFFFFIRCGECKL